MREAQIILCSLAALAVVVGHTAAAHLERTHPRPERPRVALLADVSRAPSSPDGLAFAGVAAAGLATTFVAARVGRRRLLDVAGADVLVESVEPRIYRSAVKTTRVLPENKRAELARCVRRIVALWVAFVAPSLWFMLRRPPDERLRFVAPCLFALWAVGLYLYGAEDAPGGSEPCALEPFVLILSTVTLLVTQDPRAVWAPMILALLSEGALLRLSSR